MTRKAFLSIKRRRRSPRRRRSRRRTSRESDASAVGFCLVSLTSLGTSHWSVPAEQRAVAHEHEKNPSLCLLLSFPLTSVLSFSLNTWIERLYFPLKSLKISAESSLPLNIRSVSRLSVSFPFFFWPSLGRGSRAPESGLASCLEPAYEASTTAYRDRPSHPSTL